MGKDARLSFRISEHLSDRVDKAIEQSGGQIRDRSEFGTKATKYYLDYIENIKSERELMLEAILGLASKSGVDVEEITQIKEYLANNTIIPDILASAKDPQAHPDFEKLLSLFETWPEGDDKKQLSITIRDAAYDEIPGIYKEWADKFFTEKITSK